MRGKGPFRATVAVFSRHSGVSDQIPVPPREPLASPEEDGPPGLRRDAPRAARVRWVVTWVER